MSNNKSTTVVTQASVSDGASITSARRNTFRRFEADSKRVIEDVVDNGFHQPAHTYSAPSQMKQDRLSVSPDLTRWQKVKYTLTKYAKFIGPGLMVSVAYMDPGNYSTDVSAGAEKRFALLFVILLSNILAMFLQSLAVKLGAVTGKDLAVNCRDHLPKWLGYVIYVFAEIAIIATDIAEVIGTAIALNILMHIPLIAGVILTIVDVLLVLLAYQPGKGMKSVRIFELMVAVLVFAVVICFAIELTRIPRTPLGPIFRGFLPSHEVIEGNGMYLACGILGATVMPHSLYLGSSLVRPRVRDYDKSHGNYVASVEIDEDDDEKYHPSIDAINYSLRFSIIEVIIALCTLAMFVNSSILIVAGATMYGNEKASEADLYGIYDLLNELLSKAAGVIFMVALLFSGQSAGIVCTIAGQVVCEGHIRWKIRPWLRRVITRGIAIIPCVVVAGAVGKTGLNTALNASQVALSILLPFLTAPLVYLTSKHSVMTVWTSTGQVDSEGNPLPLEPVTMANSWLTTIFGVLIWLFICILNVYLIVVLGMTGSP